MKPDYTHFEAVVDRSGSMVTIAADTEGGFNSFIEKQKAEPGTATGSLTIFDNEVETLYSFVNIQDIPAFHLVPRGWTALLDAIGVTITKLGLSLAAMPEDERPSKVVVLIMTDGEENSSKEYTYEQIAEMVKEQADVYNWEFVFMGANIDAFDVASKLNIKKGSTMNYSASSAGVEASYLSLTKNMSAFRSGARGTMDFDDSDKAAQADLGIKND
jgi:uncharacterized protein YegL